MICTIMQPAYLPWLGYFDRIEKSDVFVVLDHVDIDRNSRTKFANRNRIRTPNGWQWLTVPIVSKGVDSLRIYDLKIQNEHPWQQKHLASIRHSYSKAKAYSEYAPFIDELYSREWTQLAPLCDEILQWTMREFGITTNVLHSSEMKLESQKDELILEICQSLGADQYISGPFGRDYLDLAHFKEAGVEVFFHDYKHPEYPQVFPGFEPYMSAVDLLFQHGTKSLNILRDSQP